MVASVRNASSHFKYRGCSFSITGYPAYQYSSRNSHAHGWSTAPTYVLSTQILGIQLLSPMGTTWSIKPRFVDLQWAQGGYATSLGEFVVNWSGGILKVTTPSGTQGNVTFEGETRSVQGGGTYVWQSSKHDGQESPSNHGDNHQVPLDAGSTKTKRMYGGPTLRRLWNGSKVVKY